MMRRFPFVCRLLSVFSTHMIPTVFVTRQYSSSGILSFLFTPVVCLCGFPLFLLFPGFLESQYTLSLYFLHLAPFPMFIFAVSYVISTFRFHFRKGAISLTRSYQLLSHGAPRKNRSICLLLLLCSLIMPLSQGTPPYSRNFQSDSQALFSLHPLVPFWLECGLCLSLNGRLSSGVGQRSWGGGEERQERGGEGGEGWGPRGGLGKGGRGYGGFPF